MNKLKISIAINLVLTATVLISWTYQKTCYDCSQNGNMKIKARDALKMISAYKYERAEIIDGLVNSHSGSNYAQLNDYTNNYNNPDEKKSMFIDSRAITFPIDTIKNYICQIENKILQNNLNVRLSGLRFYYIVYDTSTAYVKKNISKEYFNVHSILIAPTYYDKTNNSHTDFDPDLYTLNTDKRKKGKYRPKPLNEGTLKDNPLLNFFVMNISSTTTQNGAELNIQNKGSLCPPPFPCRGHELLRQSDLLCTDPQSTCE